MKPIKIFQRDEIPYSVKKVNRLVLIIQRSKDDKLIEKSNLSLFNCMKKVVDKNVNNYLLLVRNSGVKEPYEAGEIVIECFLIMNKCIKKYKVQKGNNFYFYFNKSLSRTLFRLYEKELKRNVEHSGDKIIRSSDFDGESASEYSNRDSLRMSNVMDLTIDGILLDNLNMDEIEKLICMSKVNEQKREDFLIENPTITNNMYYYYMKNIKTKLLNLKRHGQL